MDASLLTGWENFYVIIGSSAGGLTGLTFVVIALIRDVARAAVQPTGVGTFVTPTIVHFGGVLALAAFMNMPHQRLSSLSAGFAVAGLAGVIYGGFIALEHATSGRHLRSSARGLDLERDPADARLRLSARLAVLIWRWPTQAMYAVAALSLVMLFIGIRNAWDIAVWMTLQRRSEPKTPTELQALSARRPTARMDIRVT